MLPKVKEAVWQSFLDEYSIIIEKSRMITDSNSVSCIRGCCVVGIGLVVTGSRYADCREPEDGYQDMATPTIGAHNEHPTYAAKLSIAQGRSE